MNQVISVVPRLPPAVDGLGDYAIALARELREKHAIVTLFLVCDPKWVGAATIEDFQVLKLEDRSKRSFMNILEDLPVDRILLHYVGYGYAKRGCPTWLALGIDGWLRNKKSRSIVTFLHEIYADGPIWTSPFWTSWLQKWIARKIIRRSRICATNSEKYSAIIQKFSNGIHQNVKCLPVFSNIGEPEIHSEFDVRRSRMIVFGGRGQREKVYETHREKLQQIIDEFRIKEVIDIGPALGVAIPEIFGANVKCLGVLPASAVSELLLTSKIGLVSYPENLLTKSGIFAAYCSHGLIPIVLSSDTVLARELNQDKHYYVYGSQPKLREEHASRIASAALHWYRSHRLSVHGSFIAEALFNDNVMN